MAKDQRDQEYEYKQVLIPNSGRKAQEKALNKAAVDGWELVQTKAGGGWTKNTATFRRRKIKKQSRFGAAMEAANEAAKENAKEAATARANAGIERYEKKTVTISAVTQEDEDLKIASWVGAGWEVTSKVPKAEGAADRIVHLRRKIETQGRLVASGGGREFSNTLIGVGVITVLAIGAFALLNSCGDDKPSRPAATSVPTSTTTARPSVAPSVTATSTTAPPVTAGQLGATTQAAFTDSYGWPDEPFWASIIEFTDRDAPRVTVVTSLANKDENKDEALGICRAVASVLPEDATGVYVTAGSGGPFLAECNRP